MINFFNYLLENFFIFLILWYNVLNLELRKWMKKMSDAEKKYYVSKTEEVFKKNPWVGNLAVTIKTGNKITAVGRSKSVVDVETGEVLSDQFAIVNKKIVDKEEFVKIFGGAIGGMFELSKTAQDLFKVVLQVYIDQDFMADRVYLSETVLKEHGYTKSKPTRQNAINQLLAHNFIARMEGEQNWYWVNPNMIFKGDRLTLINDYAIKGTDSAVTLSEQAQLLEFKSKQGTLL